MMSTMITKDYEETFIITPKQRLITPKKHDWWNSLTTDEPPTEIILPDLDIFMEYSAYQELHPEHSLGKLYMKPIYTTGQSDNKTA